MNEQCILFPFRRNPFVQQQQQIDGNLSIFGDAAHLFCFNVVSVQNNDTK